MRNPRPKEIGGQHEQRLAYAIPAIKTPSTAVQAKFGILVGENLRLRGPEPMRSLKPMHGIGCPQLPRLHHESEQPRGQTQENKRVTQPTEMGRNDEAAESPERADDLAAARSV